MEFSKEQIIRAHASAGIEALAYIKALEERLEQMQIDLALAKADQIVTDSANEMHGANLNEVFLLFQNLPRASHLVLELYSDGSGQVISNVPVNTLCGWDDLSEAKAAIEQAFAK